MLKCCFYWHSQICTWCRLPLKSPQTTERSPLRATNIKPAAARVDAATRERASSLRFTTRVCEGFIISKAQQALFINIDQDINSYEEQKVKYNNDKYRLTKSGFPFSSLTPRTAQRIINAAFQETFTSPSLRRRLLRSKQQQWMLTPAGHIRVFIIDMCSRTLFTFISTGCVKLKPNGQYTLTT